MNSAISQISQISQLFKLGLFVGSGLENTSDDAIDLISILRTSPNAPAANGRGVSIPSPYVPIPKDSASDAASRTVFGADLNSPYTICCEIPKSAQVTFQRRLTALIQRKEWIPLLQKSAQRKAVLMHSLAEMCGCTDRNAFVQEIKQVVRYVAQNDFVVSTKPPPIRCPLFVTPSTLSPSAPPLSLRVAG